MSSSHDETRRHLTEDLGVDVELVASIDDAELQEFLDVVVTENIDRETNAEPTEVSLDDQLVPPTGLILPAGQNQYLVRLLWKLPADTPYGAVLAAIDQINAHGLKDWTWRVMDWDTEVSMHVDGYGNIVDTNGE